MKKLLATLLIAGSLAITACQPNIYTSSDAKGKLSSKEYTVEVYAEAEAKQRLANLNYEGVTFTDALYAEKGKDDDKDLLIAFFFASVDDATNFTDKNNHENLGMLDDYGAKNLGANLKKKVGTHNNVAYIGSETSFAAAFN